MYGKGQNIKPNPGVQEKKTPEREENYRTLQEWLDWKYLTREEKVKLNTINLSDVNFTDKNLERGKLDLQGFMNLETILVYSVLFTKLDLIAEFRC